jgi:hypothetical protein
MLVMKSKTFPLNSLAPDGPKFKKSYPQISEGPSDVIHSDVRNSPFDLIVMLTCS